MGEAPFISIIMPNWNNKDDTLACIESLRTIDYPRKLMEIIIVDNGSKDDSVKAINNKLTTMKEDGFYSLKQIANETNIGAPAAYNLGIRNAYPAYDYIWKIDNDILVSKDTLKILVDAGESNKRAGIIGGKVFYLDDKQRIWFGGGKISWWKHSIAYHVGEGDIDNSKYNQNKEVDYLTGCSYLIKREVIKKIGLLDEDFFIYLDDTDWCMRNKKAEYINLYVPSAKVWHGVSKSMKKNTDVSTSQYYFNVRNRLLFMKKHASFRNKSLFLVIITIWLMYKVSGTLLLGRFQKTKAILLGIRDFLTSSFGSAPLGIND